MDDIFEELREQDDIEQIVEGDAEEAIEVPAVRLFDDRDGDGDGDGDDSRRVIVAPKKRVSKPRLKLDVSRLTGPRGIDTIESVFENVVFKGKGYELEDVTNVLNRLQHWAHRLYPRLNFEDCVSRIEELGHKKQVQRALVALRLGMTENVVTQVEGEEEEPMPEPESEPVPAEDPFDRLLAPAPPQSQKITLTEDQRARMLRNRLIAEERRMAKLKEKLKQQSNLEENSFEQICTTEEENIRVESNQIQAEISSNDLLNGKKHTDIDDDETDISNLNSKRQVESPCKVSSNETELAQNYELNTNKSFEIEENQTHDSRQIVKLAENDQSGIDKSNTIEILHFNKPSGSVIILDSELPTEHCTFKITEESSNENDNPKKEELENNSKSTERIEPIAEKIVDFNSDDKNKVMFTKETKIDNSSQDQDVINVDSNRMEYEEGISIQEIDEKTNDESQEPNKTENPDSNRIEIPEDKTGNPDSNRIEIPGDETEKLSSAANPVSEEELQQIYNSFLDEEMDVF